MICGQKSILIILSTSLLQIWFSLGKKGQKKKKKKGLNQLFVNGLLLFFHLAPKLEISQKRHLIIIWENL